MFIMEMKEDNEDTIKEIKKDMPQLDQLNKKY
jgi:hypothetical protein